MLLILVGISIAMLSGNNSILNRAVQARDDTVVGQEKEYVELAYVSAAARKLGTDVDESDMQTELNSLVGANKTKVTTIADDALNVLFYDTEHNYNVHTGIVTRVADGLPVETWSYNNDTQTVTNGTLTLNIGDYVNDTGSQSVEGFDGKWRVLGAEDGQLLLTSASTAVPISEDAILPFAGVSKGYRRNTIMFSGKDGFDNVVNALNAVGQSFNNSKLEKGRSIKEEDLNNISSGTEIGFYNGGGSEYNMSTQYYGKTFIYKVADLGHVYSSNDGGETWTDTDYRYFYPVGETVSLSGDQTYEVTNNFRDRYITYDGYIYEDYEYLEENEKRVFDLIEPNDYRPYLLANTYTNPDPETCSWGVECVCFDFEGEEEGFPGLFHRSRFIGSSLAGRVRPVICLKSDITPTFKSTDSTTGISTYEI